MGCYYIYKGEGNRPLPSTENELLSNPSSLDWFTYATTVDGVERQLLDSGEILKYELYAEDPNLIFYDSSISPREETLIRLKKAVEDSKPLYNAGDYKRVTELLKE
jgi:hypothetical protein